MSEKEMIERIAELEAENIRLKNGRVVSNVSGNLKNEKELAFVYPTYSRYKTEQWQRSSNYNTEFSKLRDTVLSVVDNVTLDNKISKQKVNDLNRDNLLFVSECCDEIMIVLAKYKKQYLTSIGRKDIPEAFGL